MLGNLFCEIVVEFLELSLIVLQIIWIKYGLARPFAEVIIDTGLPVHLNGANAFDFSFKLDDDDGLVLDQPFVVDGIVTISVGEDRVMIKGGTMDGGGTATGDVFSATGLNLPLMQRARDATKAVECRSFFTGNSQPTPGVA